MNDLDPQLFEVLNQTQLVGNQLPVDYGAAGLSSQALDLIEFELGIKLPPDFRYLFENLNDPRGVFFPWANFSLTEYQASIDWVLRGIAFDIEHNTVWLERWGTRPLELPEAKAVARLDFESWPKLLPISGHRFLAAEPCLPGNPFFSVMQTDIIYYGANLADYLLCEFTGKSPPDYDKIERKIPIWSDFAERTDGFNAV